jgi:rhodanese-related sulfurtransferase
MKPLSAPELAAWLADGDRARPVLLDVREPWENNVCRIEGSQFVPMQTIPQHVAMFLERQGFSSVFNLTGGVDAWARQVDPAMPTY